LYACFWRSGVELKQSHEGKSTSAAKAAGAEEELYGTTEVVPLNCAVSARTSALVVMHRVEHECMGEVGVLRV
jgi:hypothetical protein